MPKNLKGDDYPFELEEEDYVEMVVVGLNCERRLILKRESGIPHEEFLTMPNLLATEIGRLRDVVMTFKFASCLEQTNKQTNKSLSFKHRCENGYSR